MLNVRAVLDVAWELEGKLNSITGYARFQPVEMYNMYSSARTLRKNCRRVITETLLTVRLLDSNSHLAHENNDVNPGPKQPLPPRIRRTVKVAALAMAAKAKAVTPVVSFILGY